MHITETALLPAAPRDVFPFVEDLSEYPRWLRLVHSVTEDGNGPDGEPAWQVELRAKIGVFARSKKLRMVRTVCETPSAAAFERGETDHREHASWALRAELTEAAQGGTNLTMHLRYDGDLWAGGGVVGAVLNHEIRRGRDRLIELVR